ncbi:hypothetical protein D0N36_09560 [Hymenobacter lapidiphilus]|nr:hypothetical protein D0N36_09560 [Hymenobacter sp. CCM 8763]
MTDDFLDSTWFKMARLDTFSVASKHSRLRELTPAEEQCYFQKTAKPHREDTPAYFYSLQQNTPNRQEITVLMYDGEYMSNLWRLVYDARHQLISRQKVAAFGADGMQVSTEISWFETPNRLRKVFRDEQGTDIGALTHYKVDSVVTDYALKKEQFQELRKQAYQRRYRRSGVPGQL